ncbi:MAG TPA: hypothetical protein VLK85_20880 [Ramlibacter sp.]|nr:hypothetical protein [Ramlibacter sp.]
MKFVLSSLLIAASAALVSTAFAHSDAKARHGGIVQFASDLSFELVGQADGAILYVEDHGKPLATQGMTGKLTVLNGANKSEAELKPAGDNKLEAKGVQLGAGAKAVAVLTTASRKAVTVRFTVKK